VAGLTSTAVDVILLAVLVHAGVDVALAAFAGAAAGAAVCFLLNKYVAFRDHRPIALRQVAMFALVAFGTATFMALAMHVACSRAHVPYLVAKLLCGAVIFVCWSYPVQRRLVFATA